MKTGSSIFWLLAFTFFSSPAWAVNPEWATSGFEQPESAQYDPRTGVIFVSSNGPKGADGNTLPDSGFISTLSPEDGRVIALNWDKGLKTPNGLKVFQDRLYVVEKDGVAVYQIFSATQGRRLKKVPIAGQLLNDIDVDSLGRVYVTDTFSNRVHRVSADLSKVETVASGPHLLSPNGVLVLQSQPKVLLAVSGTGVHVKGVPDFRNAKRGRVVIINPDDADDISMLAPVGGYDGVALDLQRRHAVADFGAGLVRVFPSIFSAPNAPSGTIAIPGPQGKNTPADISVSQVVRRGKRQELLLVPVLSDNQVIAIDYNAALAESRR